MIPGSSAITARIATTASSSFSSFARARASPILSKRPILSFGSGRTACGVDPRAAAHVAERGEPLQRLGVERRLVGRGLDAAARQLLESRRRSSARRE